MNISITIICNDNNIVPSFVSIMSIFNSKKSDTSYDINIVCENLTDENRTLFQYFDLDNILINTIDISQDRFYMSGNCVELINNNFTSQDIIKFRLAEIIDGDKTILLDSGCIVSTDLSELYNTNLESNMIGAVVQHGSKYNEKQYDEMIDKYFNSNVLLLDLNKIRSANIPEQMIRIAEKVKNTEHMLQTIYNVTCKDNIHYLPLKYNSSAVGYIYPNDKSILEKFNNLIGKNYKTIDEICQYWSIFHFKKGAEPWNNPCVPNSKVWYLMYRKLPKQMRLLPDLLNKLESQTITISLTSWPSRINSVHNVIESIYEQTYLPDRVVIYLSVEQFKDRENSLPHELLSLINRRLLNVVWCNEDLKTHKKYFYSMQEFPDDIIVTVDDDEYLSNTTLEELIICWLKNPNTVCARRTNLIMTNDDGYLLPYEEWIHHFKGEKFLVSSHLLAVGCGGILYPPSILGELVFNRDGISNCLFADDLWLKAVQLYNKIPVSIASDDSNLKHIPNTQEVGLFNNLNGLYGGNDEQLKRISKFFDNNFATDEFFLRHFAENTIGIDLSKLNNVLPYLSKEISKVEDKLKTAYVQKSEINSKLQLTYKQKSEINAKLQLTYKQKSEINAKLQLTYKQKSEINAKLNQAYLEIERIKNLLELANAEIIALKSPTE